MPAVIAPSAWPVPLPNGGDAWQLGRRLAVGGDGLQWDLRRNCALTPAQMGKVYASLCLLSLLIAAPFALQGAPVVLAFAGLELLAIGAALLVFARHVRDGETLTLSGRGLTVEQSHGSRTSRLEFRAGWVSVEPRHGEGSLVELAGEGQQVRVGRFLSPHLRPLLAQELRRALRSALVQPSPAPSV